MSRVFNWVIVTVAGMVVNIVTDHKAQGHDKDYRADNHAQAASQTASFLDEQLSTFSTLYLVVKVLRFAVRTPLHGNTSKLLTALA